VVSIMFSKPFKWRRKQKDIVDKVIWAIESGYDNVLVDASTGIGKSIINYAVAKHFYESRGYASFYTTPQVVLLDQLENDELIDIAVIKGRRNYKCEIDRKKTAHNGPCRTKRGFNCNVECEYRVKREIAKSSPISAMSFAYLIFDRFLPDGVGFGDRDILIVDEGDDIESWAVEFGSFTFKTKSNLKADSIYDVVSWVSTVMKVAENRIMEIKSMSEIPDSKLKELEKLEKYYYKLLMFVNKVNANPRNWAYDTRNKKVLVEPVDVGDILNDLIWCRGSKRIISSATIISKEMFVRTTGLKGKSFMIRTGSIFPVENRPVYYWPIAKMTKEERSNGYNDICRAVDKIIDRYRGHRILVHAHSYEIAKEVYNRVNSDVRVGIHDSKNRNDMMNRFIRGELDVLVSVGFNRGVDLKGDLCRCQIITKCFTDKNYILTPDGLVPVYKLKPGDKVISYNIKTGMFEEDEVVRMYKEYYNGVVYRFTDKAYDVEVTPDHVMVGAKRKHGSHKWGDYRKRSVRDLLIGRTKVPVSGYKNGSEVVNLFDFVLDDELIRVKVDDLAKIGGVSVKSNNGMSSVINKYFNTSSLYYDGNTREYVFKKSDIKYVDEGLLNVIKYQGRPRCKTIPLTYDAGDFLELCGWYISEGYVQEYLGDGGISGTSRKVVICQDGDSPLFDRIMLLLNRMGITYHIANGRKIVITSDLLYRFMKDMFGSGARNKKIDKWVYNFSSVCIKRMFESMVLGDGCIRGGYEYYTSSKRLVDDIKLLVRFIGMYVTNVRNRRNAYELHISNRTAVVIPDVVTESWYSGYVYCPTVKRNGTVVAGINGKLIVTGNCPFPSVESPRVKELWVERKSWKWARYQAIKNLVQASGRIVRSEDDWGHTYILDSSFGFLFRYKKEFPKYFVEAVQEIHDIGEVIK